MPERKVVFRPNQNVKIKRKLADVWCETCDGVWKD